MGLFAFLALCSTGILANPETGELQRPSANSSPRRIVAIGPNSAEIICALGACDRIVGVSKFCVYPPELGSRPQIGGLYDPDLERIAVLRPDLLVTRGRNDALIALCDSLGVRVYDDLADSLAGIERTIRELGEILSLDDRASVVVQDFQDKLSAIRERVADQRRPRVFLTIARRPDRLANILTAGRGTFLNEMLEVAGGENVFGDVEMRYPEISPEGALAKRPDVIIELMPEVSLTPALEQDMRLQWRGLGNIPAVESGRIYFLADDHSLIPSPRYHQIIEKVAGILHGDANLASSPSE